MSAPVILLLNAHSLRNAGDAALLQVTVEELRRAFPLARLLVSSNYPAENGYAELSVEVLPSPGALIGTFSGRMAVLQAAALARGMGEPPPAAWRSLVAAYRQADVVLSLPGNPFFSIGKYGWPLLVSLSALELARRCGKPLYILPQTLGPFTRPWHAGLARRLLRQAQRVFLRDGASLRLLQSWYPAGAARLAYSPDPCFALQPAPRAEAEALLRRYGYDPGLPALGVSVVSRMTRGLSSVEMGAYYAALAQALDEFSRGGARLFFFAQSRGPTAVEDDRLAARGVMARLANPERSMLVDEHLSPGLLKACYGCMDAVLAGRLHAGLFALGMGVPALFIGYLGKTRAVLEALGAPEWALPLAGLTGQALGAKLRELWQERQRLGGFWQTRAARLAAEALDPYRIIADDLAALC